MSTIARLHEALSDQAKREAARCGSTPTALIEQRLRTTLVNRPANITRATLRLPPCKAGGGRVDLNICATLLDRLDSHS